MKNRFCLSLFPFLAGLAGLTGCGTARDSAGAGDAVADPDLFVAADSARIMEDLSVLAHDSMEGRRTGTPGGARAQAFLLAAFEASGLEAPPGGFRQPFEFTGRRDKTRVIQGTNLVGWIRGSEPERGAIVLTAHFDHMGVRAPRPDTPAAAEGDSIFNGADDNASGTVGIMSLARYFTRVRPRHDLVFAAVDAEEMGLRGARAFVEAGWPERIVLNVNLDMVARSDSLLFMAGTHHYPQLKPLLEQVLPRGPVVLRFGHDQPDVPGVQDWTGSSDHGAFHSAGIPFVYFGVEDHPDYHRPSDEVEKVAPGFFVNAIRTVLAAVLVLDEGLGPPPG